MCVSVTMGIKAALPKYELYFYSSVLGLTMIWAASWIFEVSSCEYKNKNILTVPSHIYSTDLRIFQHTNAKRGTISVFPGLNLKEIGPFSLFKEMTNGKCPCALDTMRSIRAELQLSRSGRRSDVSTNTREHKRKIKCLSLDQLEKRKTKDP